VHKSVQPYEALDRLTAELVLVQQRSELSIVFGSLDFAGHVGKLKKLNCFDDTK